MFPGLYPLTGSSAADYAYYPYGYGPYGALTPYGTIELTESSPAQGPFTEPLSLQDVQSYLNLPVGLDPQLDSRILMWITGAREMAETFQKRDLVRKQFDLSMDYWWGYVVELRNPLITVDLVQYTDSDSVLHVLTEGTDYIVDTKKKPGLILPPYNSFWPPFTPRPSSAILVRFTSGHNATSVFWNDAGARIKNGMLQLISTWFNNRLPFDKGVITELPYSITDCFMYGGPISVR